MKADVRDAVRAFLIEHADTEFIEMVWPDMNGVIRGKWLPVAEIDKLAPGGQRLPHSTYALDIFSQDTDVAGVAQKVGDPDGLASPLLHTLRPMLWSHRPAAQCLMTLTDANWEGPSPYDPRAALARVTQRFAAAGLRPVVAPELEFYLVDGEAAPGGHVQPPLGAGGLRLESGQAYLLDVQRHFEPLLSEIEAAAEMLGATTTGFLAEFGPGQFEANLNHVDDALIAADRAVALRRAVRGVARKHGMDACFMAKPYGEEVGSGQHFHVSVLDAAGANIFSGDDDETPNRALSGAIGGVLARMPESTLGFAPHFNSYRRLRPGAFAPSSAAWGVDNRNVAVRVPTAAGGGARLEHRVAGSDANPYIALALILAAMLEGIDTDIAPGPPAAGATPPEGAGVLPGDWGEAIRAFESSEFISAALGPEFARVYAAMKRQEADGFAARVSDVEHIVTARMI
ncbi:glutamine synthetase [Pikeienuella piscinae]|uniref:Glutamine synthetase n=1 Tax=Pikeienuella piscinae TaxID=2748098 RepID=A0A7L5BV91_9RHOB|nr:glutamine synthetase family protein [Pikeienuella piscinae]QIE56260.1 glutamine synthetase [Pikeienuella piscinae]